MHDSVQEGYIIYTYLDRDVGGITVERSDGAERGSPLHHGVPTRAAVSNLHQTHLNGGTCEVTEADEETLTGRLTTSKTVGIHNERSLIVERCTCCL